MQFGGGMDCMTSRVLSRIYRLGGEVLRPRAS